MMKTKIRKVIDASLSFISMHQALFCVGFLIIAVLYPIAMAKNTYFLRLGIVCLMNIALCLSLNLLTGYMGQLSLAHAAFYGIGSYGAAICCTYLWKLPPIVGAIVGIIFAGISSLFIAIPTVRLHGFYLAIVTMGFSEIVRMVEINAKNITGGAGGIRNIPKFSIFGYEVKSRIQIYFFILILVILFTYMLKSIIKSRYGRSVLAVREDEIAAQAMGICVKKVKRTTFVLSAMMAGAIGAFYAFYISFIDPSAFTQETSTKILSMCIVGGMGSLPGSYIGAIVLTFIPELTRALSEYRFLFYGIILILAILFLPDGLMGRVNFDHIRLRTLEKRKEKGKGGENIG